MTGESPSLGVTHAYDTGTVTPLTTRSLEGKVVYIALRILLDCNQTLCLDSYFSRQRASRSLPHLVGVHPTPDVHSSPGSAVL